MQLSVIITLNIENLSYGFDGLPLGKISTKRENLVIKKTFSLTTYQFNKSENRFCVTPNFPKVGV